MGACYSGWQFGMLGNTDVLPNIYGGTSSFFIMDLKANYRIDKYITLALDVGNLTDGQYLAYHPHPSRIFYGQLKWCP